MAKYASPLAARKGRPPSSFSMAMVDTLPPRTASGASTLTERQCDTGIPVRGFNTWQ